MSPTRTVPEQGPSPTSRCVLAGRLGMVSSTVANNVRRARPTSFTMGTYSSGGAGWILLDISMTAFTRPVTFSYTLSWERSRLAVGGGLISWG